MINVALQMMIVLLKVIERDKDQVRAILIPFPLYLHQWVSPSHKEVSSVRSEFSLAKQQPYR